MKSYGKISNPTTIDNCPTVLHILETSLVYMNKSTSLLKKSLKKETPLFAQERFKDLV